MSKMTIDELKTLCDQLVLARNGLADVEKRLEACDLRMHYADMTITITDLGTFSITKLDRGYLPQVVRGREMILLGIKKVLAAEADARRDRVAELEQAIAGARVKP